jgi:hypothetical protein
MDRTVDILSATVMPMAKESLHKAIRPVAKGTPWLSQALLTEKAVDGAILSGMVPANSHAKFAIPKGLPKEGQKSLAIENDPHVLDGFDGVIKEGYGKGTKTLLLRDTIIVKMKGKTFPALMEYHVHDAEKAGLHYDLCVEGVPPGTRKFEVNIPRGEYKGRYAFQMTPKGMIVLPMKDRGEIHPKPQYNLKGEEFLREIAQEPGSWVVEQKLDGSLGNVVIHDNRAAFRSHRETGATYYDKLPQLEFLDNKSPMFLSRLLFSGPQLDGTVLKGELYHGDGAPRVAGILNALPEHARRIQHLRGPVRFYGWDIVKLRGKDVRDLPYAERRLLLEIVISDIRRFNKHWDVVPISKGDPHAFYQEVIQAPLPYGEGVVIKKADQGQDQGPWYKVKQTDFVDLEILEIQEGQGKYQESVGRFIVRASDPGQGRSLLRSERRVQPGTGEVGSFRVTDEQRRWIWEHRRELVGSVGKFQVQELTARGIPRAGVFIAFHEGKGSEAGLAMYAESLAGGDPELSERTKYALKSAAGWRR